MQQTAGAFVVIRAGAASGHRSTRLGVSDPAGVQGQGVGTPGFSRNLRDPDVSVSKIGPGRPNPTPQARLRRREAGSEDRRTTGYRQTKATKCGETNVGESESFIVPWKPGNTPAWTRWREGGTESWDRWEETRRIH